MVDQINSSDSGHNFRVVGLVGDAHFQMGRTMLREIKEKYGEHVSISNQVEGLLEFDWRHFLQGVILNHKGGMWTFQENVVFFHNSRLVGGIEDIQQLLKDKFNYVNCRPAELYQAMADEAYRTYLASESRDVVYLDVNIDNQTTGRLLIELYSDKCPKTSYNFKCLCTGEKGRDEDSGIKLHFQGSIFHRVVKNGWIQGGDIDVGKGTGGLSIYGPKFEDESFAVKFDRRGIIAMANHGRHTNRSQFFITLQACPWMEKKYVAFGRVLEGFDILNALEQQESFNERPKKDCVIQNCGVFYDATEAKKAAEAKEEERKQMAFQLKTARLNLESKPEDSNEVTEKEGEESETMAPTSTEENKSLNDTLEQVAENASNFIV